MFNPKELKTFEDWKEETLDQLVDSYAFDLHEAINDLSDFDEEKAKTIDTFDNYCLDMYFSYISDLINP
jgi:hypothetical protein